MIPIGKIKKDMEYSGNLKEVIDILKLISSAEFGRVSEAAPKKDILEKEVISSLGMIERTGTDDPFLVEKKGLPECYIIACSDEGFLGEMNNRIVSSVLSQGKGEEAKFVILGERGGELLKDTRNEKIILPAISSDIKSEDILKLTNYIFDLYKKEEIGSAYIIYMKFISFTSHKTETKKLLPCNELLEHVGTFDESEDTLLEPGINQVLEYLVKIWLENNIHNIFWSSKLSEWAIRIMRLESSSDELKDMMEALKFKYFKSVHELSDKVIREIFAAKAIWR